MLESVGEFLALTDNESPGAMEKIRLYDKIDDGPGEVFAETFPEDTYGKD